MFNNKVKLYFCIAGELGAGVILLMSAVQTFPVKYQQQVQVDQFRGQISNPANVGSPFAPFLGLMGIACFGDGLRRFWQSFEDDELNFPINVNARQKLRVYPPVKPIDPQDQYADHVDQRESIAQPIQQEKYHVSLTTTNTVKPDKPEEKPRRISEPSTVPVESKRQSMSDSTPNPRTEVSAPSQSVPVQSAIQTKIKSGIQRQKKNLVPTFNIENFKYNKLSTVFAGAPRTGKSTTHLAWMAQKYEVDPNVQFRVVTQKRNSFLGLDQIPGVVQVVSRTNCYAGLFWQTNYIYNELRERLDLPEDERDNLSECWLVLDDWFSIAVSLEKSKDKLKACWDLCKSQFSDIITLGAEFGVGISVNTHTLNIKHLGVAEDSNIRSVLSICAMGRIHIAEGRKEGGFDAISNVLRNNYMVDEYYADDLKQKFNHLRDYSTKTGLPVVLSTMGEPEINIMPDLSWIKNYKIPIDQGEVAEYFDRLINIPGNTNEEAIYEQATNDINPNWQETAWEEENYHEVPEDLGGYQNGGNNSIYSGQGSSLDFHQDAVPKKETGDDGLVGDDFSDEWEN